MRACTKPGCTRGAVATLTYDYRDSTAVLGPLATAPEPHTYDLCEVHAESLTVPRGWQVMRLQTQFDPAPPSGEDLMALVEVIRNVAGRKGEDTQEEVVSDAPRPRPTRAVHPVTYTPLRRHHLTVITGEGDDAS